MTHRNSRSLTATVLLLTALILTVVMHSAAAPMFQEPKQDDQAATHSATQEKPSSHEGAAHKEAAQETPGKESEAAKQPAVIQFLSRKTGLSPEAVNWICVLLNFLILIVLLWMVGRKSLPALIAGRNQAIQKGLEEARKATEEARGRLQEVESRLARLDSEINAMRAEAETASRADEQRMVASAEEERRRIVTSAEQEIASAASSARRELKSYAAGLAVDLAARKIQVSKSADQSLVREFTAEIGKES